ncbi:bifunctional serine/threonine-protein kinase/ABC transporter substrate-binding protein [Streptomyces sp. NRRL F-2664]|uniref:bifunctional serine/threonine-protein kinase/ABC transporter substrate-binding protein n=1 Tax=Streptomyces sp. NRRL F-2664 TaxID=1463842 RepID=UPI0004CAF6BC|nr:bifunctional serine/threonine-protein kinase/ABC transporter substrate-binding protein [Streptomyces sp. NRRL F-2664]
MRPLLPADPAAIGGNRLLGRLGSGGMGTVYLGRSPEGVLVAVKVIRADHGADPAFRERFRREAYAAGALTGRWVVPVVAADPGAREPWLATPYVPGPSLAEAVGGYGPLPVRTVRILGVRLAEALAEVHAAGLVHRDVKPGNVLLAPDGPRLIDFGIARAAGATTLTAVDAVVGTPGYLAPELARADGTAAGPAGDVFSLGCVLAYAATGTGPFGAGHAAAVVFRTVHEQPELGSLPSELHEAVGRCLRKEPAERPTLTELAALLGPDSDGAGDPAADWLPAPLPRIIAERSTRALDLPAPEPTRIDAPEPARQLTRRRLLAAGGALVAAGAPIAWFTTRGRGGRGTPPAGPDRTRPVLTLALQADLTGPGRAAGQAHERGIRLAVDRHNARSDAAFRLALRIADDAGDPQRAARTGRELAADPAVLAVLGPTWDAALPELAGACLAADLALVAVSVNSPENAQTLWRTACITRPGDEGLGLPVLHYLSQVRISRRTAVVEDSANGPPPWQVTRVLQQSPPAQGTVGVHRVPEGTGFAATVRALTEDRAEAVVYVGTSPQRVAELARALADARFQGPRVALQHAMEPAFLTAAGPAAEGWVFSALFTDPGAVPAAAEFVAAHRGAHGAPPARWAAEAYDAVGLISTALAGLEGEGRDRAGLSRRIFRTTYQGIAKTVAFDTRTRALAGDSLAHLYRAEAGALRYLGRYTDVRTDP